MVHAARLSGRGAKGMLEKIEDRGIKSGGRLEVWHVAAARDAEVVRAGNLGSHFLHDRRRGLSIVLAGKAKHRYLDDGQVRALVERDETFHGCPIRPLRYRRISLDEERAPGRIGIR